MGIPYLATALALVTCAFAHHVPRPLGVTVQLDPPVPYHARHAAPSQRHRQSEMALRVVMFGECRGQGIVCMQLIGHTVLNRDHANLGARYGKGIIGVVAKPYAYSCMLERDPNWRVIQKAMEGRLAPHSPDGIAWTMAAGEAHILMHRWEPDPTHGAAFYYARTIKAPAWVRDHGMTRVAATAGHVFYRKA